ncbi:hypothetical protein LOTGIDRAFT_175652 [Lottia gigantea]|uniref:Endonuclease/exonuclease/phosphatase domain-containing protein n=1 Tax=Lottia gigantea TaxID=225164 RepID=V4AH18_LOTGI|nr:hypothetical protein LOTGIDRAFT_175652 [Lottia gigantea]ESO92706.1 hypothetical protein LOTGIDRAFT_175652 [Lottia gigantea]
MDSNRLLCGRPFGGCAILWKSGLLCNFKPIVSESRRVCAVMIEMGYMKVLLCNVYMPCSNSNEHEFDDTLNEIGKLIYESDTDYIVVGGDFNTDLSRTTSYHTIRLKALCSSHTLDFAQKHDNSNVEYAFESKINGDKSSLDYFLFSENLGTNLIEFISIHDGDNMSDHSISLNLSIQLECCQLDPLSKTEILKWQEASSDQISKYKDTLNNLLQNVYTHWKENNSPRSGQLAEISYDDSANFKNLKEKDHGGVGIYYSTNKACNIIRLGQLNIEHVGCNIPDKNVSIIVIYRPPKYRLELFMPHLEHLLTELQESGYHYIVMGDFNQNLLEGQSSIKDSFERFGFRQCVTESTTEGDTLLDSKTGSCQLRKFLFYLL